LRRTHVKRTLTPFRSTGGYVDFKITDVMSFYNYVEGHFQLEMRKVLNDAFDGDVSVMANELGVDMDEVDAWFYGAIPREEEQVRYIARRLGLKERHVIELWERDALQILNDLYPIREAYSEEAKEFIEYARLLTIQTVGMGSIRGFVTKLGFADSARYLAWNKLYTGNIPMPDRKALKRFFDHIRNIIDAADNFPATYYLKVLLDETINAELKRMERREIIFGEKVEHPPPLPFGTSLEPTSVGERGTLTRFKQPALILKTSGDDEPRDAVFLSAREALGDSPGFEQSAFVLKTPGDDEPWDDAFSHIREAVGDSHMGLEEMAMWGAHRFYAGAYVDEVTGEYMTGEDSFDIRHHAVPDGIEAPWELNDPYAEDISELLSAATAGVNMMDLAGRAYLGSVYSGEDPADIYDRLELMQVVNRVLVRLPPRLEKVMRMRFELDGDLAPTFDQIGELFGNVTGTTVGNWLNKALMVLKVRQDCRSLLLPFIEDVSDDDIRVKGWQVRKVEHVLTEAENRAKRGDGPQNEEEEPAEDTAADSDELQYRSGVTGNEFTSE